MVCTSLVVKEPTIPTVEFESVGFSKPADLICGCEGILPGCSGKPPYLGGAACEELLDSVKDIEVSFKAKIKTITGATKVNFKLKATYKLDGVAKTATKNQADTNKVVGDWICGTYTGVKYVKGNYTDLVLTAIDVTKAAGIGNNKAAVEWKT